MIHVYILNICILLLSLFPAYALSEDFKLEKELTYVCGYKCFGSGKICQDQYSKSVNGYKDKYHEFKSKEDSKSIALSYSHVGNDGVAVFSVVIDKQTLKFAKNTLVLDGGGTTKGNCVILKN